MMGGQVGLADHITVGSGAMLGAQSGSMTDVPAGERWVGSPAQPVREFMRSVALLRRLTRADKRDKDE
jgi:UDP-3-O-[3-hydroxymyristoyl] glucosamine N-acyltransferase